MSRPRLVQLVACVFAVVLFVGASQFMTPINDVRSSLSTITAKDAMKDSPPEYAFAIQAFGAFRSLITNVAFIRAEKFKDEGRYYDAMQLAEWICKLQPHFPAVWEFHSWNQAWNISVTTFTDKERWHWVYNGAKLIRDEGLIYNPRSVNLYKQLAWVFQNKMGANTDMYHITYKKQWAWRMELVMGPPPLPPYEQESRKQLLGSVNLDASNEPFHIAAMNEVNRRQEELGEAPTPVEIAQPTVAELSDADTYNLLLKAASLKKLQEIEAAPRSLEGLYVQYPEARDMVRQLWDMGIVIRDDTLDENAFMNPQGLSVQFFYRYRLLTDVMLTALRSYEEQRDAEYAKQLSQFDKILGVTENKPAGKALVRFLQRKVLTEVYKNEPTHMASLVRLFGAVDWRLVDSQSLYWATKAIIVSEGAISDFENDKTNTLRLVLFSLQDMARRNVMLFFPNRDNIAESSLTMYPDPPFFEAMQEAYLNYARGFGSRRADPDDQGVGSMFGGGHVNFLAEGVRALYFSGRTDAAEKYYEYLRDNYGKHRNGEIREIYTKPLEEYVISTYRENVLLPREAIALITGFSNRSFLALAKGDTQEADTWVKRAEVDVHDYFNGLINNERNVLPPFELMYADAFAGFMTNYTVKVDILARRRAWQAAPLSVKQKTYRIVYPVLQLECEALNYDIDLVIPRPAGVEEIEGLRKDDTRVPTSSGDEVYTPAQSTQ